MLFEFEYFIESGLFVALSSFMDAGEGKKSIDGALGLFNECRAASEWRWLYELHFS